MVSTCDEEKMVKSWMAEDRLEDQDKKDMVKRMWKWI